MVDLPIVMLIYQRVTPISLYGFCWWYRWYIELVFCWWYIELVFIFNYGFCWWYIELVFCWRYIELVFIFNYGFCWWYIELVFMFFLLTNLQLGGHHLVEICWNCSDDFDRGNRDKLQEIEISSLEKILNQEHMTGWWFQPLWKIWKSVGIIIPNIWKNKKCSKPPTSITWYLFQWGY